MADDREIRGFAHYHDDESLLAYMQVKPEQKLEWLHAAWQLTVDLLPVDRREVWLRFRRGEI